MYTCQILVDFIWSYLGFCCSSPVDPSWDVKIDANQDRMEWKPKIESIYSLEVACCDHFWKLVGLLLDHEKPSVLEMVQLVSTDLFEKMVVNVLTLPAGKIEILLCSMRFWKLNKHAQS